MVGSARFIACTPHVFFPSLLSIISRQQAPLGLPIYDVGSTRLLNTLRSSLYGDRSERQALRASFPSMWIFIEDADCRSFFFTSCAFLLRLLCLARPASPQPLKLASAISSRSQSSCCFSSSQARDKLSHHEGEHGEKKKRKRGFILCCRIFVATRRTGSVFRVLSYKSVSSLAGI